MAEQIKRNYIITIARGFGTGGKQIAMMLAKKLGIECFENRILTLASQYSGYDESMFSDEKLSGSLLANKLLQLPVSKSPRPVVSRFVSDRRLFDIQSEIIRRLADTQSCVIVGKCADYVLRDYPNVLSVYVEAPRTYCIKRLMSTMPEISESVANELITTTDRYRSEYYRFYTSGNRWDDVLNYDLVLNTGRVAEEDAVQIIIETLKLKLKACSVES